MNIVVIGAGPIGSYIATLLSDQENNVILVDKDEKRLEEATRDLDVMTRVGSGSDWQLLDDLLELSPQLLLAMTTDDEINLVACSIAKNLGYPQTIARLHDERYFNRTRLDFERIFSVDHFVGPELLVAQDMFKAIVAPGSVAIESFAHGAVQMRTIVIPDNWHNAHKRLASLDLPDGIMIGLIRRSIDGEGGDSHQQTIFPHGNDQILPGDQVTFIGEIDVVASVYQQFGIAEGEVKSAVIVGGTLLARNLVRLLESEGVSVKLIEGDYDRCCRLADSLPRTTIIHHDPTDLDFLRAERVASSDVFVPCLYNDEANLLASLLAKDAGCERVVSLVSDVRYVPIIRRLGIAQTVSSRGSVADRVLSLVRSHTVTSMVSLHENQAEILEVKVSLDSKFVGIPISEIGPHLPEDFLIAVIQNRGRVMVANGRRILSPGDTMIVISSPRHVGEFHKIF